MPEYDVVLSSRPNCQLAPWPVEHPYVEACWAAKIGPTGVLLMRRTAAMTTDGPVTLPLNELAATLGVGDRVLTRAMQRVASFRCGVVHGHDDPPPGPIRFAVYDHVTSLHTGVVAKAPEAVRDAHHRLSRAAIDASLATPAGGGEPPDPAGDYLRMLSARGVATTPVPGSPAPSPFARLSSPTPPSL